MTATQNGDDHAQADWDGIKREARGAAKETAGEAREAGYAFVNSARDRAADYVERRKESAVQSIDDVAHTLRESSETFEDRPNIRLFVDSAADGLENLADEIRERSFVEVYSDLEQFARRRPAVFATAAGVAGFMLARFLKSSADEVEHRRAYGDEMRHRRNERRTGGHAAERQPPAETRTGPVGTQPSRHERQEAGDRQDAKVSGTRTQERSGGEPGTSTVASAHAAANAASRPQGER